MSHPAEKISESEYEVMKVLWESGQPMPVTDIRRILHQRKSWEATTVKTLIARLTEKGAVIQEKRNVYYYAPSITEKEYGDWATGNLISRLYRGSAKNLVAALVHSDELTREDIDELRAMFRVEE